MPPRAAPRFDESVPLGQGGLQGSLGVGCPVGLPTHHDNPLEASRPLSFRLLSPFGKGDFQRSASSEGGLGESLLLCPSLNPIHFTATSPF